MMPPNNAFESGRAEKRRVLNACFARRAAQRERWATNDDRISGVSLCRPVWLRLLTFFELSVGLSQYKHSRL